MNKTLRKHQKKIEKLYKSKSKKLNNKKSFFSNFILRTFLSSVILLILSIISRFFSPLAIKINSEINKNINFLKINSRLNTIFSYNLLNNGEKYVYSVTDYENVLYENGVNYVSYNTYAGVNALTDGIVTKITKDDKGYNIDITSSDDIIYSYKHLENIDVYLYKYVSAKEVIGKSIFKDNLYRFELIINKNNKQISYYETAEN